MTYTDRNQRKREEQDVSDTSYRGTSGVDAEGCGSNLGCCLTSLLIDGCMFFPCGTVLGLFVLALLLIAWAR